MNYTDKMTIIDDFEKLIAFYSNKFSRSSGAIYYDEINSSLMLFLLELIQSKKCISRRYCAVCIRNKYYEYVRKFLIAKNTENEYAVYYLSDSSFDDLDDEIFVEDMLLNLTKKQRDIVKLHALEGFTFAEIAEKYNVSAQAIYKSYKVSVDKLKSLL